MDDFPWRTYWRVVVMSMTLVFIFVTLMSVWVMFLLWLVGE